MRRKDLPVLALGAMAYVSFVDPADAADKFYVGPAGFSSWSIGSNWSPSGAPMQGDNVFFTPSDSLTRSINFTGSSSILVTYSAITLAPTGTGVVQLFNNADLEAVSLNVGVRSSFFMSSVNQDAFFGSISLNGGTIRRLSGSGAINVATFAHHSGEIIDGDYNVSQQYTFAGGVINGLARINNNGSFNATGGTLSQGTVVNNGTFTFTNGGGGSGFTVENNGTMIFAGAGGGMNVNNHGTMVFNADPSIFYLRNFSLPMAVQAGRSFTINSGLQQDGSTFTQIGNVAVSGSAVVFVNGGTYNHQSGTLAGAGAYNIVSGTFLAAGGIQSGGSINLTNGTFLHSTGPVTLTGRASLSANVAGANSLYRISAGTLSAGTLLLSSVNGASTNFAQLGGDVLVGTLAINREAGGVSVLNQSNGRFQVSSPTVPAVNNGAIIQSGGLSRYYRIDGTGSITVGGSGSMTVTGIRQSAVNLSGNGRIYVSTTPATPPILLNALTFEETGGTVHGALDLGETPLIIDYSGASPVAAITRYLKSGYASGNWTGSGLRSNTAALDVESQTGVGLAQATEIGSPPSFVGQPIDNTTLLLRYTFLGDANLSGGVNLDDFTALAAGFGQPNSRRTRGDFNYDGATNLDDFTILAANFGQSLPSDAARSSVPEPAGLGIASAAALFAFRRRRAG